MSRKLVPLASLYFICALLADAVGSAISRGEFHWKATPPVLAPQDREGDYYYSVKDPSIVRYGGRWHLFCTIRGKSRSHQIEYLSFADWPQAQAASRTTLHITDGYFAAPEVFYYAPQKKWYLIYQAIDKSRTPALQPAFSTSTNLDDAASWTAPQFLYPESPATVKAWLDFRVICDERQAHLFFTADHGQLLRADAPLDAFSARLERTEDRARRGYLRGLLYLPAKRHPPLSDHCGSARASGQAILQGVPGGQPHR
jgi:hypothetical protein